MSILHDAFKRWKSIAARFSFNHCPIPITLHVLPDDLDGLEVRACLHSRDHETGRPLKLWQVERISAEYMINASDELIQDAICYLVERGWEHEIREFTRFDGKVLNSPHRNEATPRALQQGERT